MTASALAIGERLARTAFPEREDKARSAADQWALGVVGALRRRVRPPVSREVAQLRDALDREAAARAAMDDATLLIALRRHASRAVLDLDRPALHAALVLVAEAARRTLGIRPYPVQLFGAATLLRGRLAEMQTGEGKTLTAGLAACLAGLAGVPVHVVTVNDYLARRDADTLAPLYALAGLRVGVVAHGVEPPQRRAAYGCEITYCTGKELVFDYLRDRVAIGPRASAAQLGARRLFGAGGAPTLLRGLHFAIVDEVDSILIDEARTPLILAEQAGEVEHAHAFAQALALTEGLEPGRHFVIEAAFRSLSLTAAGREAVERASAGFGDPWRSASAREHLAVQALRAQHLFKRDQHYLIDAEGKVQIIDEYTGRVLPGRSWEQGLHQMIEAREGVALSERTQTLARITYQRFFCRYLRLAGMTGTARETASELAMVYRLETVVIPTHRPGARRTLPARLCADETEKWRTVADTVARAHRRGQPVLVGTRSLQASERLSAVLAAQGLPHAVLNARQDAAEAAVVAAAGQRSAITVATNMAGRGTDILLGEGVAELGGLFVILTEYHESSRIDRQLVGRCARQGDPGVCQAVVALDDELFRLHGGTERGLLARFVDARGPGVSRLLAYCRRAAQSRAERIHARARRDTLRQDRNLDTLMSFSGDSV